MLIMIIIGLVFHVLSLKMVWYWCQIWKIGKVQSLGRHTNENKKNIHKPTEEFGAEPTVPLQYVTEEKEPNVFRISTLICPVTIQEWPPDDIHPQAIQKLTGIL